MRMGRTPTSAKNTDTPDVPVGLVVRRIGSSLKEFRKDAWLAPTLTTLETIVEVAIPFMMAYLIDRGIAAGDSGYVLRIGALLLGLVVLSLLLGIASGRFAARASTGLAKNLREDQFAIVQTFAFSNIDKFSTGSLITRLTTDVSNVQMAFMMLIRVAIRAPAMFIFALIMAFRVNPSVASTLITLIPVLGIGLFFIMRAAYPLFGKVFRTYDRLNTSVQEDVRGIRVVKSFVREDHEVERFNRVSGSIYKDFTKAERIVALNAPLMQFSVYLALLLIAWVGAHQIVADNMTTGQLVSVITYAIQILMSLMMLSMVFVMVLISRASAGRIAEVLGEEADIVSPATGGVTEVADGSVEFIGASFSYSDDLGALALEDVTLTLPDGAVVGIIGGTGAGKTSLVQLIPRLYDTTTGTVRVGGVDVRDYDLGVLRQQVSIVLQQNVLFSGTIESNLRWGRADATEDELWAVLEAAQAADFVRANSDGLNATVEQGGTNFSGGQRQRLCIARALLKQPRVLILDDSTSAVDTATEARLRESMTQVAPGVTTIVIAQRITSVMEADVIVVMDGGQVVDTGTHDELMRRSEVYQEIYVSQQSGALNNA